MWVWESPPIIGLKLLRVLYRIRTTASPATVMNHFAVDIQRFGRRFEIFTAEAFD
jgi:hypothetical protein